MKCLTSKRYKKKSTTSCFFYGFLLAFAAVWQFNEGPKPIKLDKTHKTMKDTYTKNKKCNCNLWMLTRIFNQKTFLKNCLKFYDAKYFNNSVEILLHKQ